jgi:hypothetical protein
MMQAREQFNNGNLWTVAQWLLACRGRSATDARDFVFAGLSLIDPDFLSIQQSLLLQQTVPRTDSNHLFVQRRYYPQSILPRGVKRQPLISQDDKISVVASLSNLLPNGLWSSLKPDYTASKAETFVNAAACLLSHSGTAELLSIAGRATRPDKYRTGFFVAQGDHEEDEPLPSWVPDLGSWTVCLKLLRFPESLNWFYAD